MRYIPSLLLSAAQAGGLTATFARAEPEYCAANGFAVSGYDVVA